jgi:hypothetical protein
MKVYKHNFIEAVVYSAINENTKEIKIFCVKYFSEGGSNPSKENYMFLVELDYDFKRQEKLTEKEYKVFSEEYPEYFI